MVIIKQYWYDVITASVSWWRPAERNHTILWGQWHWEASREEEKTKPSLAPNIHLVFADSQRSVDGEFWFSFFFFLMLFFSPTANCLRILVLYNCVIFPLLQDTERTQIYNLQGFSFEFKNSLSNFTNIIFYSKSLLLNVPIGPSASPDICQKYRISGPSLDLWNLPFSKIPKWLIKVEAALDYIT